MELSQELKMHVAHMKASFKSAKDWKPMWFWAVLAIVLAAVMAAGFVIGLTTEMSRSAYRDQWNDASLRMMETDAELKGNPQLKERFRRQAVDRAMVQYLDRVQAPRNLRDAVADIVYVKFFRVQMNDADELKVARIIAEKRLALLAKPQTDSLADFQRRGMSGELASLESKYEREAKAYSLVLGREIKSSELLTDSDLRAYLKSEDQRKAFLGIK